MNDMIDWLREQYELRQIRQRETKLFRCLIALGVVQIVLVALIKTGVL